MPKEFKMIQHADNPTGGAVHDNQQRGHRGPRHRSQARHLPRGEFARRVAVTLILTVLIVGLVVFIGFSIRMWLVVYLGVLLAIFIRTISDWVCRWTPLPEKWSVATVLVALIILFGLASWWLATPLVQEAIQLQQRLPQAISKVQEKIQSSDLARFLPSDLGDSSGGAGKVAGSVASKAVTVFSGSVEFAVAVLVVLFVGIYVAFTPQMYVRGLVSLFPVRLRPRAREILDETGHKLRHWILGQFISMTAVGCMISLGLWICGVPLPLALGVLAGLLDIIPIFGPIIGAVPAILLAFTVSPWHALYVVGVFVAANQIEQHLLIPLIQRYSVELPPALTVVALMVLGTMFGVLGMLLAAPITATILVLVKHIYIEDTLGDRGAT